MTNSPKINKARLLLTELRDGEDYAHAGDREAVDLVLKRVLELNPQAPSGRILDVGSGFGKTAQDFYDAGFKEVYGIDKDEAAVQRAKSRYPKIQFFSADANRITSLFKADFFSLITMFNVIYAIEDKKSLLKDLAFVAKKGGILALFDYTQKKTGALGMKDLAGMPMYPMVLSQLKEELAATGWELIETSDLSKEYIRWYRDLLKELAEQENSLAAKYEESDISRVKATFTTLLSLFEDSTLGGALLFARRA